MGGGVMGGAVMGGAVMGGAAMDGAAMGGAVMAGAGSGGAGTGDERDGIPPDRGAVDVGEDGTSPGRGGCAGAVKGRPAATLAAASSLRSKSCVLENGSGPAFCSASGAFPTYVFVWSLNGSFGSLGSRGSRVGACLASITGAVLLFGAPPASVGFFDAKGNGALFMVGSLAW
jgi:hypothetical protein